MNESITVTADVAEYAAMYAIPYDAAHRVFSLIGHTELRRILNRGVAA